MRFRGGSRRAVLSLDAGAERCSIRRLLRLGAVGASDAATDRQVRLARVRLVSPRPGPAGAIRAAFGPRPPAFTRPRRGAGLDRRRRWTAWIRRHSLQSLQRGRGGALFLRAVPGSLRSGPPQTARRLVHARRGGATTMVARVDRALKDDLGIADGLAGENVYVLDPCCGTGAYLAAVLRRIAANLQGQGLGALTGAQVQTGSHGARIRLRDHARAVRRRPLAGRPDHAGARRPARRRRNGAR